MHSSVFHYYFIFILFFCFFYRPATAQIVIESNEYDTSFGIKHYLYEADENTGVGFDVDVGQSGGPQHWEYSMEQFPNGDILEYTNVDPATTPLGNNFPDADHSWHLYEAQDSLDIWIYFDLNSASLDQVGMAFASGDSSFVQKTIPPEIIVEFPASINTSWSNNYATHTGIAGLYENIDSTSSESVIDAWGTITLPSGTYDCLRVYNQETDYYLTYAFGELIYADSSTYIEYNWLAEDVGLLAGITSVDGVIDPNFTKAGYITLRVNNPASFIDNKSETDTDFRLYQNYPNPFNPVTNIGYQIPDISDVELNIYNSLGQKVATLVNKTQAAGHYDIQWDASDFAGGIYLFRLNAGTYTETKKLILLK